MPIGNTQELLQRSQNFADKCQELDFDETVHTVYNPLNYAWEPHAAYLVKYANPPKKVVFLGMNPGPFGMAQTGVPFGEIAAVKNWLKIEAPVTQPPKPHPKRPIQGFGCSRSEVSGRRLWGLFAELFGDAATFFDVAFVHNYCPLAFLSGSGSNLTPDKLPAKIRGELQTLCDQFLIDLLNYLRPTHVVGVGAWATQCLKRNLAGLENPAKLGTLLHPSPASPVANREWPDKPTSQLRQLGLLPEPKAS